MALLIIFAASLRSMGSASHPSRDLDAARQGNPTHPLPPVDVDDVVTRRTRMWLKPLVPLVISLLVGLGAWLCIPPERPLENPDSMRITVSTNAPPQWVSIDLVSLSQDNDLWLMRFGIAARSDLAGIDEWARFYGFGSEFGDCAALDPEVLSRPIFSSLNESGGSDVKTACERDAGGKGLAVVPMQNSGKKGAEQFYFAVLKGPARSFGLFNSGQFVVWATPKIVLNHKRPEGDKVYDFKVESHICYEGATTRAIAWEGESPTMDLGCLRHLETQVIHGLGPNATRFRGEDPGVASRDQQRYFAAGLLASIAASALLMAIDAPWRTRE